MRLAYKILIVFAIFSCKPKQMKITQIEDTYAKKNGEIPNENIFLIENFSNSAEGIITVLNYTKDTIAKMMPFKKENGICNFVFNKNDVTFEDGTYNINTKKSISIYLNEEGTYFKSIHIYLDNSLPYKLKGKSDIFIDYEEFNLSVFKTFLDAIKKERGKIQYNYTSRRFEINGNKVETFEQEYELISREAEIECTVNYIDKDNFIIKFPNHTLNKTLD